MKGRRGREVLLHHRQVSTVGVHERSRRVLPKRKPGLARSVTVDINQRVGIARGGSRERVEATRVAAGAVPVGSGLATRTTEVEPGLAVGSRSVVAHAAVVGRSSTSSATLVAASTAAVAAGTHEGSTGSAVDLGEGVDMLELGTAKVARVVATATATATSRAVSVTATTTIASTVSSSSTTSSSAAAAAATAVAERRVLALELGLDTFAVGGIADRRENRADTLNQLES
jgi:hypothetical protein